MTFTAGSIILIDDREAELGELAAAVVESVGQEGLVETWVPSPSVGSIAKSFAELAERNPTLVVTDHDLTERGVTGLFGPTVISWCQERLIPVGKYSRGKQSRRPMVPSLYEIAVPSEARTAAVSIVGLYRGLRAMEAALDGTSHDGPSTSVVLASVLGVPHLAPELALYSTGLVSGAVQPFAPLATNATRPRRVWYEVSHFLVNLVLRYPGPLLHLDAACAYLAVSTKQAQSVADGLASALYDGPFRDLGPFFWRHMVDDLAGDIARDLGVMAPDENSEVPVAVVEQLLGSSRESHECNRCGGSRGGLYCPFARRAVCLREDCSLWEPDWLPEGASACRVEVDYYEEWSAYPRIPG